MRYYPPPPIRKSDVRPEGPRQESPARRTVEELQAIYGGTWKMSRSAWRAKPKPAPPYQPTRKPVESPGNWWPDCETAARALGRKPSAIRQSIRTFAACNGTPVRYSKHKTREQWEADTNRKPWPPIRTGRKPKRPVKFNGRIFESIGDAARSLEDGRTFAARYKHITVYAERVERVA